MKSYSRWLKLFIISAMVVILLDRTTHSQDFALIQQEPDFNLASPVESTIEFAPAPADAIAYVVADLSSLPAESRPFQRYIWIPKGDKLHAAQISFAVNTAISKSSVIIKPTIVAEGRLSRWDLRKLAPRDDQYATLHALWEKLAFEPYFHITKTTEDAVPTNAVQLNRVAGDPFGANRYKIGNETWFRSANGIWFLWQNNVWVGGTPVNLKKQKVAVFGAHCDPQNGLEQAVSMPVLMQGLSQSSATVVRYDWFLTKVLSTLDGGMYYDFIGVDRNPKGKTAQVAFLESIGVTEEQVAKLRADQRAAIFRSNVTGRPRRIDAFQGSGVRLDSGSGLVTITHDVGEGDVAAINDPIRNLLNFNDKARELIAERSNGLHYFLLFNSDGSLQDSAPDDVVRDHTIPSPHPARLQPAISCIRCHGPTEGLQPFDNDVKKLLAGQLDVFDDLSSTQPISDTLERLAGLYSGDLSKPLRRGRDDYSDAIYIATDGLSTATISDGVSQTYGAYHYNEIDAYQACLELGYRVPKSEAVYYFNLVLPPLPKDSAGVSPEDPIIGALKTGLKVNRFQWEAVYADAAFRAMQSRKVRENIK